MQHWTAFKMTHYLQCFHWSKSTQAVSLFSFSSCTVKVKDMRLKWEWREFKSSPRKPSASKKNLSSINFVHGIDLSFWKVKEDSLLLYDSSNGCSNSSCLSLPFRLLGIRFLFNPITLKTLLTIDIGDWNFSSSIPFTDYSEFAFPEKVLLGIRWVHKH